MGYTLVLITRIKGYNNKSLAQKLVLIIIICFLYEVSKLSPIYILT